MFSRSCTTSRGTGGRSGQRPRAAGVAAAVGLLALGLTQCDGAPGDTSGPRPEPGAGGSSGADGGVNGGAPASASRFEQIYFLEPMPASVPMGYFATGVALADITGDGLSDAITSSGNDIAPQSLVVQQSEAGHFRYWPDWYSGDIDYHGDLAVGDVDGDGWIDIAVSVAFGRDRRLDGGGVKIYRNLGGRLEDTPSYRTEGGYAAIGCALGDVDGDGDLDLAVAVIEEGPGDALSVRKLERPGRVRIYLNRHGAIERTPSWISADPVAAGDVLLADVDLDGWMDLIVGGTRTQVHHGREAPADTVPFAPSPDWVSADSHDFSFSVDVGRVGEGPGLAVAVSSGCLSSGCGESRFVLYSPSQGEAPVWASPPAELASKLLLADLDGDPHLDLIAGQWGPNATGGPLLIFGGSPGGLSPAPDFVWETPAVHEGIAVADLRAAGACERRHALTAEAPRAVVTLPERRIERITAITRGGRPLSTSGYAWTPGDGWISLAEPLGEGEAIQVRYLASPVQDILVATYHNYAPPVASMLFYSYLPPPACTND